MVHTKLRAYVQPNRVLRLTKPERVEKQSKVSSIVRRIFSASAMKIYWQLNGIPITVIRADHVKVAGTSSALLSMVVCLLSVMRRLRVHL